MRLMVKKFQLFHAGRYPILSSQFFIFNGGLTCFTQFVDRVNQNNPNLLSGYRKKIYIHRYKIIFAEF